MLKKIYSYLIMLAGSLVVLVSCDKSDDKIKNFSALVDVSESSLADDKYNMALQFSTDNGVTFVDYPVLKAGTTYMIRVIKKETVSGVVVTTQYPCIDVDWSASEPKQKGENVSTIGEFVAGTSNKIVAKVVGEAHYSAYDASAWAGKWIGAESGGGTDDKNNITQDSSDPNKFVMDNFFGDGVEAYIIFTPSTKSSDQIITIPAQTTSEDGDLAASTGTYDQCKGIFSFHCTYTVGGKTYEWDYSFTKE